MSQLTSEIQGQLVALKTLSYVRHIGEMLECNVGKIESGPHKGFFAMSFDQRQLFCYMIEDCAQGLLTLESLWQAEQLNKMQEGERQCCCK